MESTWRGGGINKVKCILRLVAAMHGTRHPLRGCPPCHRMTQVVGQSPEDCTHDAAGYEAASEHK